MIGRLSGVLVLKQPPHLLLEVHGVGYELEAPMSTFYELPATGETVSLHVHHAVREDAVLLYGFFRASDRALFRHLLKVSGVGAKTALAVLSGVSAEEFAKLVRGGEIAALMRIPGIGKKTAERIVVELRDRIGGAGEFSAAGVRISVPADPLSEAHSALEALGYKPADAARLIGKVQAEGDSAETLIRKALKMALR